MSADALLALVRGSGDIDYEGLVESRATLAVPEVPEFGRTVDLFAQATRMRVWKSSTHARVDELLPIGERGMYLEPSGMWLWDSVRREATRIDGHPRVRFPRPQDLLPSELGLRLASAADPDEVTRIPARRVAGFDAPGLRITPSSTDTTVAHVDLWVHPQEGLVLKAEVTPRGSELPVVNTVFLSLALETPARKEIRFRVPGDARVGVRTATDLAQEVRERSALVLPDALGPYARRTTVASAAATYGTGFELVAVLALSPDLSLDRTDALDSLPQSKGAWGRGTVIRTPLLNGLVFDHGGVQYVVSGTVTSAVVEEIAAFIVANPARPRP